MFPEDSAKKRDSRCKSQESWEAATTVMHLEGQTITIVAADNE